MGILNIDPANIQAGAERHSAPKDPPDQCKKLSVQIIDSNSEWDVKTGNILKWGVQASDLAGNFSNTTIDWNNTPTVSQINLPFGTRARDGSMPKLSLGNGVDPIAPAGVRLRLAVEVDTDITLAAVVKTNADA